MKLHITIFNYEREDMLDIILDEIEAFLDTQTTVAIDYTIIDDGSSYDRPNMRKFKHGGKPVFWQRWDYILNELKDTDYDAYLFIPNDVMKIDFDRIITYVTDFNTKPYVVNIITDHRTKCWNNREAININGTLSKVFFTDCGFFCSYAALEALDFKIQPIDPYRFNKPNISSGVGQQLTQRFNEKDVPIFLPKESLTYHGDHHSLMHPQERKNNPLISKFVDRRDYKIVVGIATMSSRASSLEKVIECLENQYTKPDKVYIYNNDENDFNATDNGKFYGLNFCDDNTYYFSMDDDIDYPPSYIDDMIRAINKHNTIVTHHGRHLLGYDLNYYAGHKGYSCHRKNTYEGPIDVAGTGVTAFHTSYFKPLNLFESEYKRMSDCTFSLEAAKQVKTITLLKHASGYLKDICTDTANSCYTTENKSAINQQKICNEILQINQNEKK